MTKLIGKRYEIVKSLGTGSTATVYLCRHIEMENQLIAIKVQSAEFAADEAVCARFRKEVLATYGVSHPNVVRVYEYFNEDNLLGYTMEYIDGGNLELELESGRLLSIRQIVSLLRELLAGLEAIHAAGLVYRNLRPENILLTKERTVKLSDFGISSTNVPAARAEQGAGSEGLDYIAPEYLEQGIADFGSDIYAVGVIAYQMLTGSLPFRTENAAPNKMSKKAEAPQAPAVLNSSCPDALSAFVLKALLKDPEKRYQSVRLMTQALEGIERAELFH